MKLASLGWCFGPRQLPRERTRTPRRPLRLLLELLESRDLPAPVLGVTATTLPPIKSNIALAADVGVAMPTFVTPLNITDTNPLGAPGIAVIGADETNGDWQVSYDGGMTWGSIGFAAPTTAPLIAGVATDSIRFVPNAGFVGTSTFTFLAWDQTADLDGDVVDTTMNGGTTAFSSNPPPGTATINVLAPVAPILVSTAVAFPGVQENDTSTVTDPGTTLPNFLATLTITDPNSPVGIAVNGVDDSHGTWQFSIDNNKTWTPFSNLSDMNALLLADNPLDRIRFVPGVNFAGTATFTFRAWDQTGGVDSGFGNAVPNGGTSGYSAAVGTATIVVGPPAQDLVARVQTASATGPAAGSWLVSVSNGASAFSSPTRWDAWSPDTPGTLDWVNVMTADVNGDGHDDIIGRIKETGAWWVALSNGAGGFTTSLWDVWSPDTPGSLDWVDVHTADFNGDGKADIVGRDLETGQWWVGLSTGHSFATSHWETWAVGTTVNPITWVDVNVGDVTGDGKADIVGRFSQSGGWYVAVSTGKGFYTRLWDVWSPIAWADVQLVDLTGDGKADLIGMVPGTGQWWAAVSTGVSFRTSNWGTWNPAVINNLQYVEAGDFNGDGKVDLTGYDSATGQWFTSLSTGTALGPATSWTTWDATQKWIDVQVGDFNGDGKADVAALDQGTGQWQVNISSGAAFARSIWVTWDPTATYVNVMHGNFE